MLVLSRKPNEEIVIDGGIVVKVIRISGNRVQIGISAPEDVRIERPEAVCSSHRAGCSRQIEFELVGT